MEIPGELGEWKVSSAGGGGEIRKSTEELFEGAITLLVDEPADADCGDDLEEGGSETTIEAGPAFSDEGLPDAVEDPVVPLRMVGRALGLQSGPDYIPVATCSVKPDFL